MSWRQDLTGHKFGRLTIVEFVGKNSARVALWKCLCECGNSLVAPANNIKSGNTSSCGCLKSEMMRARNCALAKQNGESLSPFYMLYKSMFARCYTRSNNSYPRYGGRGITVCARWTGPKGYFNFKKDMGERPTPKHSIERRNNDGNYTPKNCYWATQDQQAQNKRNVIRVECDGEEMSLRKACRIVGIPYGRAASRVRKGWNPIEAIATPRLRAIPR